MQPSGRTLVVDLDGTLIRTDLLFELFWSACGRRLDAPLHAGRALLGGRAALKSRLAELGEVDVARLP